MYIGRATTQIIEGVSIFLPTSVKRLLKEIEKEFLGQEFAIVGTGFWGDTIEFHVDPQSFYIPKQTVTQCSVNPEEDPGGNFVIHKHPDGILHFSQLDLTSLTPNFDVSLLWVRNQFQDATARVKVYLNGSNAIVILRGFSLTYTMDEIDVEGLLEQAKENIKPHYPRASFEFGSRKNLGFGQRDRIEIGRLWGDEKVICETEPIDTSNNDETEPIDTSNNDETEPPDCNYCFVPMELSEDGIVWKCPSCGRTVWVIK